MSNHLAIATITATLQRTLQAVVQVDVEGARTTTVRPSDIGNGTPETGVNIFLYQVITNPALNNIDATPFRSKGTPTKRQAALDLYYMLSFYGNDNELIPQRLLGSVVRTLNDRRTITQDMIRSTCEDTTFTFLRDSNLADQIQQMSIVPLDLNLEDLSKTWTVFFQTPYVLSIAYKVLVVLIEGQEAPQRALPVRDRRAGSLTPFNNQPVVEQVMSQAGRFEAIRANSTLLIQGKQLKGIHFTQVRISGIEVTPPDVSPTQITLPLSSLPVSALRAGVQSLQVIHPVSLTPERGASRGRRGAESNAAPLVLRPAVTGIRMMEIEGTDDEPRSGRLTVQVDLTVGRQQRVVLTLNEWSTVNPTAYIFDAEQRDTETHSVTVPFQDVKPGEYLVRLQIDGAESQLEVDTTEGSPTQDWYIGPRLAII
jgi:hypothetical protein